ncbi:hypothetical protein [Larkinella terrae]|uniref:Ppx/GppA phosphatase domain-containing protein n=1 Tax=Larkinella terrae TaxID=2025311 RepID=A0A7K0EU89_9BACT|nr:hypothetical protein [Larkinella terrae]MRS65136.1 hypothetical protein [Larkinella terrae]
MQRLTVAGRLIITALILAAIYFGLKYIGGVDLLKKFASKPTTEQSSDSPSMPSADSESKEEEASKSSSDTEATDDAGSRSAFNYTPPVPQNGKLKGVVELGASGFNSFIITVDAQKAWKLEKAEFGNSLVLENMATDQDVREGLKKYISGMLNFGVAGRDIHFVVSSGAVKAENTQKIIKALKSLNYVVNTVTAEQEGRLALRAVLPKDFESNGFVVDIGSGNTKISWKENGNTTALEGPGAKYFQNGEDDAKVYNEVKGLAGKIPSGNRKTAFIIGGVPFELAKEVRKGKERYTVLNAPSAYKSTEAKTKAGVNIYKAIADGTNCDQFVFDWDANFTIGYLLTL